MCSPPPQHRAPVSRWRPRPPRSRGRHPRGTDRRRSQGGTIRLTYVEGMDKESCPAIVSCGGRMEFHGAPMARTWVKLLPPGERQRVARLPERAGRGLESGRPRDPHRYDSPTGLRWDLRRQRRRPSGDRGTNDREPGPRRSTGSRRSLLDAPAQVRPPGDRRLPRRGREPEPQRGDRVRRSEGGPRGHVMYHRRSSGSIGYAEFRHLGKEGGARPL